VTGFRPLGTGPFIPNLIESENRQFKNDTTWIKGSHSLKFGINFNWLQQDLANPQLAIGTFNFNGSFSRNPVDNAGGSSVADLLLGIPRTTTVSSTLDQAARGRQFAFYGQDKWRIAPNFTLNLGLRYEVFQPFVEKYGRFANFDMDTDPLNPRLLVAGQLSDSRGGRALVGTDKDNFAPRFGFSYNVRPRTVIRGGYGIFYGSTEVINFTRAFNAPFVLRASITTDGINPALRLSEGVPPVVSPENARNLILVSHERDPDRTAGQQWNLNIQQELARDWLWEVGYFGSKGNHIWFFFNNNFALPGPGDINARRRFTSVEFPDSGVVASPLGPTRRVAFIGNSIYHSLQTKLEKRFSGGFSVLGSYIFSRTIGDTCGQAAVGSTAGCGIQNPRNLQAERSLDNQHIKHRFVASANWELPFGRGQRWGGNWSGVTNAILGGWSLASIATFTSGQPFTITVPGDPANTGDTNRPDIVADPELSSGERTLDRYFNTQAFAPNEPFSFGNAGRNILTGPSSNNVDLAAFKRFQITEDIVAQFRFEAFNAVNIPNFGIPGNVVNTPTFGEITNARRPRNLQFGLKLIW